MTLTILMMTLGGVGLAVMLTSDETTTLTQVAARCRQNRDSDGFGNLTIGNVNFQNESVTLDSACKIHLRPGSTLQMNNVTLVSKNLVIDDQPSQKGTPAPTHVTFNNVNTRGPGSGFQMTLKSAASTVSVKDSSFDYSLSVGMAVGAGDNDTSSNLEFLHNKVVSLGNGSEGINLVSTGAATFRDNQFQLADPDDIAVLLGNSCILENNSHANDRCQGP